MNEDGLTALVLAGTRPGGDPLAIAEQVSHKALIDIGGRAMVDRVVSSLVESPRIARVVIAIEDAHLVAPLIGGKVEAMRAEKGPSASAAKALRRCGPPLVVTTADNALLQPAWIDELLGARPPGVDVVAALATREAVETAAPDSERTWLRFADGEFSGCNLFFLASDRAIHVVELWQRLERDRKKPLTLIRRSGWRFALRYALGKLTLGEAAARIGELAGGARVSFVVLRDGRAAIDVDKKEDLALVRRLVGR